MKRVNCIFIFCIVFSIKTYSQYNTPQAVAEYQAAHPDLHIAIAPSTGEIFSYGDYTTMSTEEGTTINLNNVSLIGNTEPLNTPTPCGGRIFGFSAECWPGELINISGHSGAHAVDCRPQPKICFMTNVVIELPLSWWW